MGYGKILRTSKSFIQVSINRGLHRHSVLESDRNYDLDRSLKLAGKRLDPKKLLVPVEHKLPSLLPVADIKSEHMRSLYCLFNGHRRETIDLSLSKLKKTIKMKDTIKQSESCQMFHKYSTGLIPPKNSRGKGSQRKKTADVSQESVDVSNESEHKLAKKKTSSKSVRVTPGVLDESTVVSATLSEGTSTIPGVLDEEKIYSDDKEEKKDDADDNKSIDLEMTDDEETEYEFVQEMSDVAKVDAEKIEEIKDDAKKAELPPTSSNLSVSSGFGDQFLKLSFDTSLINTVKDITDAEINSLLDIKIQSKVPHI
nr:hypothetical protein [Tanacetum cinerariifolium]